MAHAGLAPLLVGVVIAVWTDVRTGHIRNWLTVPLLLTGLVRAYWLGGWGGVGDAVTAGILTVLLTFQFASFGGGDLKLGLGVGVWLGLGLWPAYFVGAALTRISIGLAVRAKMYGWRPKNFWQGIKTELFTGQVPPLGERSFRLFRRAAEQAGANPETPAVPGALWVAGGTLVAAFWASRVS